MANTGPQWATVRLGLFGVLGLLAAGCGVDIGGDGGVEVARPEPVETSEAEPDEPTIDRPDEPPDEPAVEQSDPEPEPTAAEPAPTEEATPRRLLVYAFEVASEDTGERSFPVERVVVHDVDANEQVSAFDVGGLDNYPVGAGTAGDLVVIATEPRVWVADQQGNEIIVLHDDPGGQVSSLAVSPDGSLAAIALPGFFTDRVGQVVVFDVGSGDVVQRVADDDPALADFIGDPGQVAWADPAGDLLAVEGYTYSEVSGSLALLSADGGVDVLPWQSLTPSPDLRAAVRSNAGCLSGPDTVDVVDLGARTTIVSVGAEPQLMGEIRWAPDSSAVLIEVHPAVDSEEECFTLGGEAWQAVLVDLADGSVAEVGDRAALEAQWDAEQGYRVDCPFEAGQPEPCVLVVDGNEIARGLTPGIPVRVAGFLE